MIRNVVLRGVGWFAPPSRMLPCYRINCASDQRYWCQNAWQDFSTHFSGAVCINRHGERLQLEHANELRQRLLCLLLDAYRWVSRVPCVHACQSPKVVELMRQLADRRGHITEGELRAAES